MLWTCNFHESLVPREKTLSYSGSVPKDGLDTRA